MPITLPFFSSPHLLINTTKAVETLRIEMIDSDQLICQIWILLLITRLFFGQVY